MLAASIVAGSVAGGNGGRPLTGPDLERFLPWTAEPSDMNTWTQPPRVG